MPESLTPTSFEDLKTRWYTLLDQITDVEVTPDEQVGPLVDEFNRVNDEIISRFQDSLTKKESP